MRFSAARRLKESSEFAKLRTEGTSYPGRYVVLSVLKVSPEKPWRCGLITSKKAGGAVQRNLIRRRLREIHRQVPIEDGWEIVTIARWRAKEASFDQLKEDWIRTARRAKILKRSPAKEDPS